MKTLTVLDFEDGLVYQYTIITDEELELKDFENMIIAEGHKINDCEWMVHNNDNIFKNTLHYGK